MYFPRKSTVALAVAATFAGGASTIADAATTSANVGVTTRTLATEVFTAGSSALSSVTTPTLKFTTNKQYGSGHSVTLYVKLNGGAKFAAQPTKANISVAGPQGGTISTTNSSSSTNTVNFSENSPNNTVLAINFTPQSTMPSGSTITIAGGTDNLDLSNASTLNTSGGQVTADFAFVGSTPNSPVTYPSSPSDTGLAVVDDSKQAIQTTVLGSGNSGYTVSPFSTSNTEQTAEINVTSNPPLTKFIIPSTNATKTTISLGGVYFKNTSGNQYDGNGSPYTFSNISQSTIKLSGNFLTNGQEYLTFEKGSCSGTNVLKSGSQVTPSSTSSVNATINTSSLSTSTPVYICLNSTTSGISNPTQLLASQNSATLKLSNSTPTVVDSITTPQSLYNLKLNGTSLNLMNFVPAQASPYMTYIKVANNGSVSAPVNITLKGKNGNTLGSGQLVTLGKNASQVFSAKQIENKLGISLQAGQRPQVQLSAPTNKLNAQSYLYNGNGTFSNMSSNQ